MVFTHLPANVCLMPIPFVRSAARHGACAAAQRALADGRSDAELVCHGHRDAAERPAAASITTVPRNLVSALGPLLAGYRFLLAPRWAAAPRRHHQDVYDLTLLAMFSHIRPPEERQEGRS